MNASGFYRDGSSMAYGVEDSPHSHLAETLAQHGASSITPSRQRGMRSDYAIPGQDSSVAGKMDQLMSMMTNTQQLLIAQRSANVDMLQKIESIAADVNELKQDVIDIKDRSGSSGKGKASRVKIPSELSAVIKKMHDNLDDAQKFTPTEMYHSKQNQRVADFLLTQLTERDGDHLHSGHTMKRAIHRYYESRRRLHNDSKPQRKVQVQSNKEKSFQKRLYTQRGNFAKTVEERRRWTEIDLSYMTEESDRDEQVFCHKPGWRSTELEALIKKLESRAQKSDSVTSKEGRFRGKERMLSSPSRSDPPPNPPPWSGEGAPSSEETPLSSRGTPGPSCLSQNPQDDTEMSSTDGEERN